MPIIKSAMKRARQTSKRTSRNVHTKRNLKTALKRLDAALSEKSTAKLAVALSEFQSSLDTAVKKNIVSKNRSNRLKARYAGLVKTAGGKMIEKKPKKPTSAKKSVSKPAKKTIKKPTAKKASGKKITKK